MENASSETISQKPSGPSVPPKSSGPSACPSCHAPVSADANFCPQCGKKFAEGPDLSRAKSRESPRGNEPPLSTSVGKQVFIYLFSFFLAPLGIVYAIRYLKQWKDPKARVVGIVVVTLTVVAIIIMIWVSSAFMQWEYRAIGDLY